MAGENDVQLNDKWRVFCDVNENDDLESVKYKLFDLGEFETAFSFWCFWNSLGGEQGLLQRLPQHCNLRMLRYRVEPDYDSEYLKFGGAWTIECEAEHFAQCLNMLLVAAVCEGMGERNVMGVSISKHESQMELKVYVSQYEKEGEFLCKMILGAFMEGCSYEKFKKNLKNPPSGDVPRIEIKRKYKIKRFKQYQNMKESRVVSDRLANFKWGDLFQLKDNETSTEEELLDGFFKIYAPYFDFEIVNELNEARKELINVEGCCLSFNQYDGSYKGKYLVLRSKLLHCQHVIILKKVKPQGSYNLNKYHCTSFYDCYRLAPDDPSMNPIPRDPLGTKSCSITLNVCHLLNNIPLLEVKFPKDPSLETFRSLRDTRTGSEFLLITYPELTEKTESSCHYFKVLRARIQVNVKSSLNSSSTNEYKHDANFDLSHEDNCYNYQLYMRDQQTGNEVVLGLKRVEFQGEMVVMIKFIRYNLCSATQAPVNKPHNISVYIPSHGSIAMSPVALPNTQEFVTPDIGHVASRQEPVKVRTTQQQPMQIPQAYVTPTHNFLDKGAGERQPTTSRNFIELKPGATTFNGNLAGSQSTSLRNNSNPYGHFFKPVVSTFGRNLVGSQPTPLRNNSNLHVHFKPAMPTSNIAGSPTPSSNFNQVTSTFNTNLPGSQRINGANQRVPFSNSSPLNNQIHSLATQSLNLSPVAPSGNTLGFNPPSYPEPIPVSNQSYEPDPRVPHSARSQHSQMSQSQMSHTSHASTDHMDQERFICRTPPPATSVPPIIPGPQDFYRHAEAYSPHGSHSHSQHSYGQSVAEMNNYYQPHPAHAPRAAPKQMERMMPVPNSDRRYAGSSPRHMYEDSMRVEQIRAPLDKLSLDPLSRMPGMYAHRDPSLPTAMLDMHGMYLPVVRQKYGGEPLAQKPAFINNHVASDPYLSLMSNVKPGEDNVAHLIGRVVYLAKSESGSRFVQDKCGDPRFLKVFYPEMKKRLPELMTDNFGHYAVEALFNQCSQNQRTTLLSNLGPQLSNVACHKQGSFSVQSLIQAVSSKEEIYLLRDYLKRDLEHIILSCPGHYVILRFISRFGWPVSGFISEVLAVNVVGFATDHYGLRVLKATFDSARQQNLKKLNEAIIEHTNSLAENQYGNYIIQHLLDVGPKEVSDKIINKMIGRFVRYSKQKFSSNVVEKCLKHSVTHYDNITDWIEIIVKELLLCAKELISDKYGNYCLQTALNCIQKNPPLVSKFITQVRPHLEHLRVNVRQKWMKLLQVASSQQMSESAI